MVPVNLESKLTHPRMTLIAALTIASVLVLLVAVFYQRRRAGQLQEREAVVLFETRADQPYRRPIFTARSNAFLHVEAPVVHARLASDILFLDVQSEVGGQVMGFELAITNVPLKWLRTQRYEYIRPESQLLFGPRGAATERLMTRASLAHDLDLPGAVGKHVHAYEIASVVCDPAEDALRFEAILPDGKVLKISYDYAGASLSGSLPIAALGNTANAQPLGIRIAA